MKRHPKFLGDMNVRKARRVSNDDVCDEWPVARVAYDGDGFGLGIVISAAKPGRRPQAITGFDARSPATHDNLFDALSAFGDLPSLQRVETGHQAGILDHEGHELGGISPNSKEFQAILLDKLLKGSVGSNSNAMAVRILKYLTERNEGLDIAARPHDLYDNIQPGWRSLAGLAT